MLELEVETLLMPGTAAAGEDEVLVLIAEPRRDTEGDDFKVNEQNQEAANQ